MWQLCLTRKTARPCVRQDTYTINLSSKHSGNCAVVDNRLTLRVNLTSIRGLHRPATTFIKRLTIMTATVSVQRTLTTKTSCDVHFFRMYCDLFATVTINRDTGGTGVTESVSRADTTQRHRYNLWACPRAEVTEKAITKH